MNLSPSFCLSHAYIPATHEDFNIITSLCKNNLAKYYATHPNDIDCYISVSKNWKSAQQCSHFLKHSRAHFYEFGWWNSDYDSC
jgi:hypothetical protein